MIYQICIYYKNKEDYIKNIRLPLNEKIKVLKNKDEYVITLENNIDTYLYTFKENEINGFEIKRIS